MPVRNYGVWVGTPLRYKAERNADDSRSPHITLWFDDPNGTDKSAAINVKSIDADSRLVYWFDRSFNHPLTSSLDRLSKGFHRISGRDQSNVDLALDYQRADPLLLNFEDGVLLPHDLPGPKNDILDELVPIIERAIAGDGNDDGGNGDNHNNNENKVYIFGSSFGTGIHDVHMNQGSLPRFDNGVGQDGAIVFYFAATNHFEAVFLAFASQRVPTDDSSGLALPDSLPLAELARSSVDAGALTG